MKSHELAKLLLENPDVELIMQKDSEGNGYSPLRGIEFDVVYVADNTWCGEVYSKCRSATEHCLDVEEWEILRRMGNSSTATPITRSFISCQLTNLGYN